MKLGQLIAAYRRENKITISQLSKEADIPGLVLWRIERGQYNNCKHVPAIIRWLFSK